MQHLKSLFLLVLLAKVASSDRITVYKSTSALNSHSHILSGLVLSNGSSFVDVRALPGLSICVRFNFKILMDGKSTVYQIESEAGWKLAYLNVGDKITFIGFGKDIDGNIPSWIVQKKGSRDYKKWSTNKWHHICMSYDRSTSHVIVVMVRAKWKA